MGVISLAVFGAARSVTAVNVTERDMAHFSACADMREEVGQHHAVLIEGAENV